MSRFKIGQKVVALVDDTKPVYFKKGDTLTVRGHCKGFRGFSSTTEVDGLYFEESPEAYDARYFAPLENIADAIEYRLKVSIPELIEIKEVQHQ